MALDPFMESAAPESTIFGVAMREEPEHWYQLIERLERESAMHQGRDGWINRRQHDRQSYRTKTAIQIRSKLVTNKANPWNTFRAYTRNLSEHGASLLLDSFVHAGTTCRVLVKTLDDKGLLVPGEVKFCKYAGHGMHEIGVGFRVRLPLEQVLESAVPELPLASQEQTPSSTAQGSDFPSDPAGSQVDLRIRQAG